ncbi:[acyl-carrier-protein] S-malonyltransferase [Ethanoligenens harbinense]|nr:[acyl-carrier-protein] S-malonyltransferase [Ethanoligenens harbinense YUAN-3]AYF39812.1 [acyl-carrier-protein] S-malonyltransferase [Ethanoligenens harbinense]AYF42644.1 [acyl-carrier-protein] S-malonyltransferase [Ethanoligenens harbinense]QCN93393.1 [acyl-carrier-protein] S-malonyltransferase [Ethanoligenens harbinense]
MGLADLSRRTALSIAAARLWERCNLGKTAFLFSGQGAQYPGMGVDLCANHPVAARVYEEASEALGFDVLALSRDGDGETLAKTAVSQPLIFTLSLAVFAVLKENGVMPDAGAGFSLGEVSALAASGALDAATGFAVIDARAKAMQKAAEETGGTMFAILGAEESAVEKACADAPGYVAPVNYNCPGQIVIAGEEAGAVAAAETLQAAGVKTVRLAVNAAFHSRLMASASESFYEAIRGFSFTAPTFPLFSNVTGGTLETDSIPDYLKRQMVSPVRFSDEIAALEAAGFDTFLELGPGKTLCGFIRRGIKGARTFPLDDSAKIEKCLRALAG